MWQRNCLDALIELARRSRSVFFTAGFWRTKQLPLIWQLLAPRFCGGLVFETHRRLYHSTLDLRITEKKKKTRVYEPQIRARLETSAHFCKMIVPRKPVFVQTERKASCPVWWDLFEAAEVPRSEKLSALLPDQPDHNRGEYLWWILGRSIYSTNLFHLFDQFVPDAVLQRLIWSSRVVIHWAG